MSADKRTLPTGCVYLSYSPSLHRYCVALHNRSGGFVWERTFRNFDEAARCYAAI